MSAEQLVFMFYDDMVYSFERSDDHSPFTFGGPLDPGVSGVKLGARPLHMVANFNLNQIPGVNEDWHFDLPLVYGFSYSGCEIRYRLTYSKLEILELDPTKSSDSFPYVNYPYLLPYVPLKLSESRPCTYPEFAEDFPNMPDEPPAELVVAVPAPATLGVSLWGRMGDAEGVTVVFECNLTDRTVRAYNRCT